MAKSVNIKTYDLSDLDNKKMSPKDQFEENVIVDDGISNDYKKALHLNPFLYSMKNPEYKIASIEEFYINIKKESKAFGAIIRGQDYKVGKKLKITKKAFKTWLTDFIKNKDRILNPADDKMQIKDFYLFSKITVWHIIGLVFTFIILAILLFKPGTMWTSIVSTKVNNGIDQAFSNGTIVLVTKLTLILAFVGLLYSAIYNRINNENKRINKQRFHLYQSANKTVEKEFKQKFKYARKYYLKNVRKDKFAYAPLPIEKTAISKVDLKEIEALTDAFFMKTNKLKKQKKYFYMLKFLTVHLSLLSGFFIFGYVIYCIIKNIL